MGREAIKGFIPSFRDDHVVVQESLCISLCAQSLLGEIFPVAQMLQVASRHPGPGSSKGMGFLNNVF